MFDLFYVLITEARGECDSLNLSSPPVSTHAGIWISSNNDLSVIVVNNKTFTGLQMSYLTLLYSAHDMPYSHRHQKQSKDK